MSAILICFVRFIALCSAPHSSFDGGKCARKWQKEEGRRGAETIKHTNKCQTGIFWAQKAPDCFSAVRPKQQRSALRVRTLHT